MKTWLENCIEYPWHSRSGFHLLHSAFPQPRPSCWKTTPQHDTASGRWGTCLASSQRDAAKLRIRDRKFNIVPIRAENRLFTLICVVCCEFCCGEMEELGIHRIKGKRVTILPGPQHMHGHSCSGQKVQCSAFQLDSSSLSWQTQTMLQASHSPGPDILCGIAWQWEYLNSVLIYSYRTCASVKNLWLHKTLANILRCRQNQIFLVSKDTHLHVFAKYSMVLWFLDQFQKQEKRVHDMNMRWN